MDWRTNGMNMCRSYDPSRPVPLVIGLHGGLMTGWGACYLYLMDACG